MDWPVTFDVNYKIEFYGHGTGDVRWPVNTDKYLHLMSL